MGWEKETWTWWPPSAATIKPRWRPLMYSALHQNDMESSVVVVRRYTNTLYIPRGSSCLLSLHMSTLSWALPLPNSHWTGYGYTGYSLTLTPRWSCLGRRERWGWKHFPTSGRHCCKAQKWSTTSLTWFHCQSFHQPPIPIRKRVPRWRKDWAFTQPSSTCKISTRPEPSWNVN